MVEHMECPRAFLGKLVLEHFFPPLLRTALPEGGPAPPPPPPDVQPRRPPPPPSSVLWGGGAPSRGPYAPVLKSCSRGTSDRVWERGGGCTGRWRRGGGGGRSTGCCPCPLPFVDGGWGRGSCTGPRG